MICLFDAHMDKTIIARIRKYTTLVLTGSNRFVFLLELPHFKF